jgi:hypothetical protein
VLIASVLIVGFTIWNERRQGGGEIAELAHMDEEIRSSPTETDRDGSQS